MAKKQEDIKVEDFTEPVKEITGIVKDSYMNGLELAFSVWEENSKVFDAQLDQWLNFQEDSIKAGRDFYEKFPKESVPFWSENAKYVNDGVDRLVNLQKEYVKSVKKITDNFTKETRSLTQKNAEKAFSLVDEYVTLFGG